MTVITIILSVEIGILIGFGIVELAQRVIAKRNLAKFETMVTEAVRDGLAEAFTPTEAEYSAYINGDSGERYTEEELANMRNHKLSQSIHPYIQLIKRFIEKV